MPDDLGTFAKAGFRAWSLTSDGWTIVLSRVDRQQAEPRGLWTVIAPGIGHASLGGKLFSRSSQLFGGTNLSGLAKDCAFRLGGEPKLWATRLDYLAQMVMGDGYESVEVDFDGVPCKPETPEYVFDRRLWRGRSVSLFGPGSAGKTTIADALLVSADTGVEIIPGWRPLRRFRAGLLDWDEGETETRVRLHAICNAYGVSLAGYHYKHMTRPLADSTDDVGRWVVKWELELLVVSPVKRALRQAPGDPAGPVDELYGVLGEFGTTNLLIDHVVGTAMAKDQRAHRAYGSVSKHDNARGTYSCYEQSSEQGRRVVVLRNEKPSSINHNYAPQAVRIEFDPPDLDEHGAYDRITFSPDEVEEATDEMPARETQVQKFVRLLAENGPMKPLELAVSGGFRANYLRHLAAKARKAGFPVLYDAEGSYALGEKAEDGV